MHTPTKQQWQTVIDNLKSVLPTAIREGHFDMKQYTVRSHDHKCGTVHCVGGWYAVATVDMNNDLPYIGFTSGAEQIAKHLGFDAYYDVTVWAGENPGIWGNKHGDAIFGDSMAYNNATTLKEVIEYLEGVRDRSPE